MLYGVTPTTFWSSMIESVQNAGAGITPFWFDFVLWFWPGLVVGALVVGGIEYGVCRGVFRNRIDPPS